MGRPYWLVGGAISIYLYGESAQVMLLAFASAWGEWHESSDGTGWRTGRGTGRTRKRLGTNARRWWPAAGSWAFRLSGVALIGRSASSDAVSCSHGSMDRALGTATRAFRLETPLVPSGCTVMPPGLEVANATASRTRHFAATATNACRALRFVPSRGLRFRLPGEQ